MKRRLDGTFRSFVRRDARRRSGPGGMCCTCGVRPVPGPRKAVDQCQPECGTQGKFPSDLQKRTQGTLLICWSGSSDRLRVRREGLA